MSMNVYIEGIREVQVVKTGKLSKQTHEFNAWQTPTKATNTILQSPDPILAYKDWVNSQCDPFEVPVYASDDYFCTGEPVGTKIVDYAAEHLKKFDTWLEYCKQEGYEVEISMI